jgi:hypothetical protein
MLAAMGLVMTVTAGMVLWIVLWAIGVSGFDGFMITAAIVLLGATAKVLSRYLPGRRR